MSIDAENGQVPVDLPPRLDDVVFSGSEAGLIASWNQLPDDLVRVVLDSTSSGFEHLVFLTASKRWLERTGATSLGLDASAPGFDPAWILREEDTVVGAFRFTQRTEQTQSESLRTYRP